MTWDRRRFLTTGGAVVETTVGELLPGGFSADHMEDT